ncbi:hypothetical protein CBR_g60039 [Chara braunii]|uniref:Myb/SANT-like DNA-binding domain-containing protein n=1 Tax=Chara braunii TaxID=69332 RepID=A0A388K8J8_CHABU|nr:hypothetical protein CBR_g60039 [Chara braunii]|eukprot:GBG66387.1 hypothetical protein CBR_g60039 [Chara braunii]
MGSQVYRHESTPTYTDLLEGRTPAGYDAGLVDMSFGLRSGSGKGMMHTVVMNPASATKHTSPSVRAAGPADSRGFVSPRRVALSTASVAASRTKTGGLAGCRTTTPGGTIDREGNDDERAATEVVGRQFWDDERQRLCSAHTSSITRGVARMSVGVDDVFVDCDAGGGEEIAADEGRDDNDEDDDGEMEIRPVGRKRGGSTATTKVRESRTGRKGKKCAEELSAGDGTKSRDFWTVEHMIALIRAKRDQDSHLAGLGHNYGQMKTKTWKWEDVEKRLVQMGVTSRKAIDCGKKWDNLYQQFKSVHTFMGESAKPNFFTLTPGERRERGFDFRMDERVYSEMKAMSGSDHTIHPTNLADTRAPGGVQMHGPAGGRNESGGSDVGGGGPDDDRGSTRDSSFSGSGGGGGGKGKRNGGSGDGGESQKGRGHVPKSKRPRFDDESSEHTGDMQGEEVSMVDIQGVDVMNRLGFGRDGVSREQLAALKQSLVGGVAVTLARTPKAAGIVMTDARVARQVPPKVGQVDTTAGGGRTAAADNTTGSGVAEAAEEGRVDDVCRDDGRKDGKGGGDDDDDRPVSAMVKKVIKQDDLEDRSKLWIACDAFWGQGPGKPLREAVGDCTDYLVAIANGDAGAEPPSMLVMPPNDVSRFKIEDPAQCEPALRRASNVEKVVLRAIHSRIFKSSSRSSGFARGESYVTVDFATDVARVWQALEWSKVVSLALVYHTLAMKMDVPLWFAGVKIVDRPEDEDTAARQEATVLRLADCWTDAVWCGQWADGGRVKQDRLTRLADCLRVLLSACMWIMRMGGDDDRSHYEASFYASMVAKPTLIAAGSYIFNWRRHIVDSTNLVLDRLGKAHLTLGDYPHCIPEWVDCGLVSGHNAALKNATEAAKHGWIGSGPPVGDDGDNEK